jgi:hypothetical protein
MIETGVTLGTTGIVATRDIPTQLYRKNNKWIARAECVLSEAQGDEPEQAQRRLIRCIGNDIAALTTLEQVTQSRWDLGWTAKRRRHLKRLQEYCTITDKYGVPQKEQA